MLFTPDQALAARLKALREYGWKERYISDEAGQNTRLDELQAAILRVSKVCWAVPGLRRANAFSHLAAVDLIARSASLRSCSL